MIFFYKFFLFLRIKFIARKIKNALIKNKIILQLSNFKFISFNGRTISFSFNNDQNNKKYFIKYFLYKDLDYKKVKLDDLLKKKYSLVKELKKKNLITYNFYKFNSLNNIFFRDYIYGETLLNYCRKLDDSNFKLKISETIDYLRNIILCLKNKKLFYLLDLHPANIIISKNGNLNIIDLDLVYIKLETENYELNLMLNFFRKSLKFLNSSQQKIMFNVIDSQFIGSYFRKMTLDYFFSRKDDEILNKFIFTNFFIFSNIQIAFEKSVSIKDKLNSTLKSLPNDIYVVARRYNWLLGDSDYQTKDIDIFCQPNSLSTIRQAFFNNGWDLDTNEISQYFESQQILVTIDLRSDFQAKFNLSFDDLLNKSEKVNYINIIGKEHYYKIMLYNFYLKKNIKTKYLIEMKSYYNSNNAIILNKLPFSLKTPFSQHEGISYLSKWYLFRKMVGNFINYKELVFIGADGAGKSTIASIIFDNLSLYVFAKKKYFSGFFLPSGRTNLFLIKTSTLFLMAQFLKNSLKMNIKNKRTSNQTDLNTKISKYRSIKNLSLFPFQFILIFFIPVFIFDSWLHKFKNRLTLCRVSICDRYYDDILINYTNTHIRKLLKYLIPNSKNKFYLYANPEEHFNRKKNEDIETIIHMQKCYSENEKYLKKFPTNINQTLITKKILKLVINTL